MGDAGFMISSIMNAGFQNQPGAVYSFSEPSTCRNSYSYSPSGSEPDFCIETPPPASACNIVSSTTMPIIANGSYSCLGPDLQQQVAQPYLRIVEEPQSKIRYRYASEKGAHGGLQGENSCSAKKTFPIVKLENAPNKKIYLKASLYTSELSPRLHVHKLTGKNCDKNNGDCRVELNEENMAVFQGLGINFTGKKEVSGILLQRIYQDFVAGYSMSPADEVQLKARAEIEAKTMMKDCLNSVRICFEAFDEEKQILICAPVFSRPVQNQKSPESGELRISRISACSGTCTGNDEVFMLCEKVNKKDIKIRFFKEFEDGSLWEEYGQFNEADVHHQVAIVFRTPPYKDLDIEQPVTVSLELFRRRDGERSESLPFTYRPVEKDQDRVARKRKKLDCNDYSTTPYANQLSFSGPASLGLRMAKMPGSYTCSQGHMSPSYQSRGNGQPQESSVSVVEEMPNSDSDDISDLMIFPSPSSTESSTSTGVSSSTDPFIHIPNPSSLFDEEMATSTVVDELSSNLLRSRDPMWSLGSSSSAAYDDYTGNPSIYFSDSAIFEAQGPRDLPKSQIDCQMRSLSIVSAEQESTKESHLSLSPEQRKPQNKISGFRKERPMTSAWIDDENVGGKDLKSRRQKGRAYTSGRLDDQNIGGKDLQFQRQKGRAYTSGRLNDQNIGGKDLQLRHRADRRKTTSGYMSDEKIVGKSERRLLADRKERRPASGDYSSDQKIVVESRPRLPSSPTRIGTLVLHSRGSTKITPGKDVRAIVQNVARALRRFLASGDVELLLYPMRDLMGVTDEDGDNAVHHIALHDGSEPQFVDASLRVVQHLSHAVINQTNNHYQTPLQLAVAVRKLNVLNWLLACGANPNVQDMQGHSALHLSVQKHHHDCLSVLLEKKLKPKLDLNLLNYKGLSPLHMAVLEGCQSCVQSLCAAGADVNTKNGICGRTALHLAVEHRTELLDILLAQENVLVDAQDYAGNTALHLACSEGNLEAALKLMRKDANPLIENFSKESDEEEDEENEDDEAEPKGKTPFDLADGNETLQAILAGTVSNVNEEVIPTAHTEHPPNRTAQVRKHSQGNSGASASFPSESASQHFSTDERSRKESAPVFTDSGFISAEIKVDEDAISRLCECLDPPNTEWKKLAEILMDDPKHIDQLCKLEESPTRALLRHVEGDQIEGYLEIADLEEFIPVLRN